MTQTHIVSAGHGTQQVQASSPKEALAIARQYLGRGDWQYVGVMSEPRPYAPPIYSAEVKQMQLGRDPLDEGN